ncbi:MAG TPA: PSD1 and planctomycete cytochrome C domain-containing protein [Planctomycetaceae bacterium]|nr:PSD1 and planctomycete cytochrome C domain-containing protein [Planctomycetaceae bacterium]
MNVAIDGDEELLLAELDFGNDPPDMLVIRETRGMRVVGIAACLILAAPFLLIVFLGGGGRSTWILLLCAALPLAVALFLVWQILNGTCFYIALDEHWLRRRRGRWGLVKFPVEELGRFESHRGVLRVERHAGERTRRVVLLKDAYAPESLSVLADRLNVWRCSPPEHREASMAALDWSDLMRTRRVGNALLWGGVFGCLVAAALIAAASHIRHPGWRGLRFVVSGFAVFVALGQIAAGAMIRVGAARKGRRLRLRNGGNIGTGVTPGLLTVWACCGLGVAIAGENPAADRPTTEQLEFFERKVRPLLAENCWKCHGPNEQKGSLRLDSRDAVLKGGDTGPALVPGRPDESEMILAVSYDPGGYQMPPTGKLPQEAIETLAEWVRMGAPWPADRAAAAAADGDGFDLQQRARHWSFQPVRRPDVPFVQDDTWPASPIDAFLLARLEPAGLVPAPAADRRTWLRRVTFDLIGLPPTLEETADFLTDDSPDAGHKLVDRLLASPHHGERWGRHWLDLVRYAETAGHEFDYDIPHAWRYRDYVVRALNADLPYDQFVVEHVAGDLIDQPRRHPAEGWNESILGTGFWWFSQGKHSPVDVRGEECDRFDNQIDVLGKAFLGLTIACARCHDHKFDPVSTADYYALAGYLQSTRQQIAFIDDGRIDAPRRRLEELKSEHRALVAQVAGLGVASASTRLKEARGMPATATPDDAEVFDDFAGEQFTRWQPAGAAFGAGPTAAGEFVIDTSAARPRVEVLPEGLAHSGRLSPRFLGVLRSETFTITRPFIDYRVRRVGGRSEPGRKHKNGQIHLIVDGFHLIQNPLYGGLSINTANDGEFHWYRQDVSKLVGSRAHIEIEDEEPDGYLVVDRILFSEGRRPADRPGAPVLETLAGPAIGGREALAKEHERIIAESVELWRDGRLASAEHANQRVALLNALLAASMSSDAAPLPEGVTRRLDSFVEEYRTLEQGVVPSRRAIAALEGTAENEHVLVRGNHKRPGPEVPRRFLEVFALPDSQPSAPDSRASTGTTTRLDLARRIADPSNPLTARVLVNRLWHHHFGRGLVPTVDNFGILGEPPSHPELLDWLAAEFWKGRGSRLLTLDSRPSLKRLHRQLVLSAAYRMSSAVDPQADAVDPGNRLWHRMPVRRLEAEIIRDAMLAVSGRLDRRLEGESVLPFLTPFMEGRGRPPHSGPLDGEGRRSLYISVRRNFLPPLFLAFDYPTPLSTMGRRSVSNVPAQALALMNNPFVVQQAELWARRTLAEADDGATPEEIIHRLYQTAFARPATSQELAAALAFLERRSGEPPGGHDVRRWADLCHVLLNVKEFVFVN